MFLEGHNQISNSLWSRNILCNEIQTYLLAYIESSTFSILLALGMSL